MQGTISSTAIWLPIHLFMIGRLKTMHKLRLLPLALCFFYVCSSVSVTAYASEADIARELEEEVYLEEMEEMLTSSVQNLPASVFEEADRVYEEYLASTPSLTAAPSDTFFSSWPLSGRFFHPVASAPGYNTPSSSLFPNPCLDLSYRVGGDLKFSSSPPADYELSRSSGSFSSPFLCRYSILKISKYLQPSWSDSFTFPSDVDGDVYYYSYSFAHSSSPSASPRVSGYQCVESLSTSVSTTFAMRGHLNLCILPHTDTSLVEVSPPVTYWSAQLYRDVAFPGESFSGSGPYPVTKPAYTFNGRFYFDFAEAVPSGYTAKYYLVLTALVSTNPFYLPPTAPSSVTQGASLYFKGPASSQPSFEPQFYSYSTDLVFGCTRTIYNTFPIPSGPWASMYGEPTDYYTSRNPTVGDPTYPEPVAPPKQITVTWVSEGRTLKTVTVVEGSDYSNQKPGDPSRTGYEFTGWSEPSTDSNGNITITATWKKLPASTDDIQDSIDNQTEEIKKGFAGILDAIKNLPQLILDGIIHLFVPNQQDILDIKDAYDKLLEDKFGFFAQAGKLVSSLFVGIASAFADGDAYQFRFPGISIPWPDAPGGSYVIVAAQDVSLDNKFFAITRPVLGTGVTIIACCALINTLIRFFEVILGDKFDMHFPGE